MFISLKTCTFIYLLIITIIVVIVLYQYVIMPLVVFTYFQYFGLVPAVNTTESLLFLIATVQ